MKRKISKKDMSKSDICPVCGSKLVFQAGCNICPSCGYSDCEL